MADLVELFDFINCHLITCLTSPDLMNAWIENSCVNGARTSLDVPSTYHDFALANNSSCLSLENIKMPFVTWCAAHIDVGQQKVIRYRIHVDVDIERLWVRAPRHGTLSVGGSDKRRWLRHRRAWIFRIQHITHHGFYDLWRTCKRLLWSLGAYGLSYVCDLGGANRRWMGVFCSIGK